MKMQNANTKTHYSATQESPWNTMISRGKQMADVTGNEVTRTKMPNSKVQKKNKIKNRQIEVSFHATTGK